MIGLFRDRPDLLPSLGVAFASLIWGLYWIPIRYLESQGLEGIWPSLGTFALCAVILLPVTALRWRHLVRGGTGLALTGVTIGAAFAAYTVSLLLTEVVRALLLFYLTPAWGTLLGIALLNERLTAARCLALALGMSGLMVILAVDQGIPLPRNAGDWLALLSGLGWAYGSLRIFRAREIAAHEQSFAFVAGGLVISVVVAGLPADLTGALPDGDVVSRVAWPMVLVVVFMLLPIFYLTIIGAKFLTPARIGILLMGEVVVGVASAAILTDEPFGLREAIGTLLVLGAAGAEVMQRQQPVTTT